VLADDDLVQLYGGGAPRGEEKKGEWAILGKRHREPGATATGNADPRANNPHAQHCEDLPRGKKHTGVLLLLSGRHRRKSLATQAAAAQRNWLRGQTPSAA